MLSATCMYSAVRPREAAGLCVCESWGGRGRTSSSSSSGETPSPGPVGRRADEDGHEVGLSRTPIFLGPFPGSTRSNSSGRAQAGLGYMCKRQTRTRHPDLPGGCWTSLPANSSSTRGLPRAETLGVWELLGDSNTQVHYRKLQPQFRESLHFHQIKLGT